MAGAIRTLKRVPELGIDSCLRAVADSFRERIGRGLKQAEENVPASSVCRLIEDQACTAIPAHAAQIRSPALSMANAAHLLSQSAVGLMASAPMISEFAKSRALWRAQRVSRSEFIRLA